MNTKKEIAKFAAGAAAWEAIGHVFLAFSGFLPLTVWGFTVTEGANIVWIVVIAAVSMLLAWYGWGVKTNLGAPSSRIPGGTPIVP